MNRFNQISTLLIKKPSTFIFILAVVFQISGIFLAKYLFTNEIIIFDPRFLQLADNLTEHGDMKIERGVTSNPYAIMINPFEIQKGTYYNWFPVGYAIIIFLLKQISNNYYPILILFQLLLFSLIPIFIYKLFVKISNSVKKEKVGILVSIISIANPYFMVSSLWRTDTWIITLVTLTIFMICIHETGKQKVGHTVAIFLSLLFFFRPIAVLVFLIFFTIDIIKNFPQINFKKYSIPIIYLTIVITLWTFKNYYYLNEINFTHSNVGYNLWLGNNQHTNEFLRMHLGDGSTIEDKIIPKYDEKWKFLSTYNEYEKDKFFKLHAWQFIKDNPLVTVENMFWKLIGFWSPLRVRDGHWSDSSLKKYLVLMFYTPLLILSLLSVIRFFWYKEYRIRKEKGLLILFMFLWMLPHLMFFSTARFRAPIDFGLYILAADVVLNYFTNIKKISS